MTSHRLFLFRRKVRVNENTGCWEWIGALNDIGYTRFWDGKSLQSAHRMSYEHYVGPIAEGMQIDHKCSIKHCVNPEHLQQVNGAENQHLAVVRKDNYNSAKTHCKQGHEFTKENTRYTKNRNSIARKCVQCRTEVLRKRKLRNAT